MYNNTILIKTEISKLSHEIFINIIHNRTTIKNLLLKVIKI